MNQPAVPLAMRLEGVRLIATGVVGRWFRRGWRRLAGVTLVVLALAPAVIVLDLLVRAL